MAVQRNLVRQPSVPERRAPASRVAARSLAQTASPAAQLQRRVGNQRAATVVGRAVQRQALHVSSPSDPAEREATSVAAAVMRMPTPPVAAEASPSRPGIMLVQRCACGTAAGETCACRTPVFRAGNDGGGIASPALAAQIHGSLSSGSQLPSGVREFMEPRFGADFSGVRVHTGEQAARLSDGLSANAFTVGQHVFFGRNQFQPDTAQGKQLIAHELTHTVQQGGTTTAATMPVQREEKSWWESFTDFSEDFVWGAVRRLAPTLEPIIRNGPAGVFEWLKTRATNAAERVFSTLMAPVRAITGVGDQLSVFFAPIVASIQTAAAKIAQNDCSPISDAAAKIEQTALKIITPIVEKVQPVIAKVKAFLNDLWDTIGAPVWEWIKQYAAQQWQQIKDLADLVTSVAKWIWDKTATIRSIAEKAWTWLKNKIGIGEGDEGQNGILQWVQRKLEAAWDWLKAKLEPFRREITVVLTTIGAVALAVSPAGPILAVGAAVAGAVQGLKWIAANWGKGNIVVQARAYLEKQLFPQLLGAAQQLGSAVTRMANAISGALGGLAGTLVRAVGTVAGSLLNFAVSAVQWLADQAIKLAAWAHGQLAQVTHWLTAALGKLKTFLNNVIEFLGKVGKVILNIWGLPVLLGERVWNWIPACIRDPVVDFIGPIILRQIEIFQELAKDDDAWAKTKADIGKIIKLVFKDHDLMGAVKATFHLILRVFNVPPDLLVTIARKAMAAWDVVVKKPLAFIKNVVRSIGHGFRIYWANIWDNLQYGLEGWLFGELAEKKITRPASWTNPKDVFFFVLEVLGLTVDHVYELLKKRLDPDKVDRFRKIVGQVTKVLDWVWRSIDTTKTPKQNAEGIWDQAKGFGKAVLSGIAEWIVAKVAEEVAILIAAAAASGGLSEVLDIIRRIYKAILTAVRWARRILDMVNETLDNILDIASGAVEKVGAKFSLILRRGTPVVIGFLADQVGLGGVGATIRGIVDKLRAEIDKAMLWFIDKIKAGIEAVIGLVKAGVAKLVDWWKERRNFKGADGKRHNVAVEGGKEAARLMVASAPREITVYLDEVISDTKTSAPIRTQANTALTHYNTTLAPVIKKKVKEDDALVANFASNLTTLSNMLMNIVGATYGELPDKASWDLQAPHSAKVEKLSTRTSKGGSTPSGSPKGWEDLQKVGLTKLQGDWKRMHLISAAIGGPGTAGNLVPAPTSVNSGSQVVGFETSLKTLVMRENPRTRKPNVVWITVKSLTFHAPDKNQPLDTYDATTFVQSMIFTAGLHYPNDAGEWIADPTAVLNAPVGVPRPNFEGLPIDINAVGRVYIEKAAKVKQDFAAQVVERRKEVGRWTGISSFMLDMRLHRLKTKGGAPDDFEQGILAVAAAVTDNRVRFGPG